jgi:hypothetical protein
MAAITATKINPSALALLASVNLTALVGHDPRAPEAANEIFVATGAAAFSGYSGEVGTDSPRTAVRNEWDIASAVRTTRK